MPNSEVIRSFARRHVVISIDQSLRTKLDPGVVTIHHEYEVFIVSLIQAVKMFRRALNFGKVRAPINERWVIKILVPIDDGRARVAQDIPRNDGLAQVWIRLRSWYEYVKVRPWGLRAVIGWRYSVIRRSYLVFRRA